MKKSEPKPRPDSESAVHKNHLPQQPSASVGTSQTDVEPDYAFYLINTLLYTAEARQLKPIQLWDECPPPTDRLH